MKRKSVAPFPFDEEPPQAFLFYFPFDKSYSCVTVQHRSWPVGMTLFEKVALKPRSSVKMRVDGVLVTAYLLCSGTKKAMQAAEWRLNKYLEDHGGVDLDTSFEFLEKAEREGEVASHYLDASEATGSQEPMPLEQMPSTLATPPNVGINELCSQIEILTTAISEMTGVLDTLQNSVTQLTTEMRRLRKEQASASEPIEMKESANEPVIYQPPGETAVDLTRITGRTTTKFAINVAKRLYSAEELSAGMLSPQKTTKSRRPLSPNRAALLKEAVASKFGGGSRVWEQARGAVNQMGLDQSRRLQGSDAATPADATPHHAPRHPPQ